jgi:hypothetical protein
VLEQLKRERQNRRLDSMLPGKSVEDLNTKHAKLPHGTASGDLVLSTAGQRFCAEGSGVSFPVIRSIAIA